MKIQCAEYEGCFSFEFIAEDMNDTVFLVRFGRSAKRELRRASASFHKDGAAFGSIVMGKRKNERSYLSVGQP